MHVYCTGRGSSKIKAPLTRRVSRRVVNTRACGGPGRAELPRLGKRGLTRHDTRESYHPNKTGQDASQLSSSRQHVDESVGPGSQAIQAVESAKLVRLPNSVHSLRCCVLTVDPGKTCSQGFFCDSQTVAALDPNSSVSGWVGATPLREGSPEPHSGQVLRGSYVKVSAGCFYRICRLGTSADPGGQRLGARPPHHTIELH